MTLVEGHRVQKSEDICEAYFAKFSMDLDGI